MGIRNVKKEELRRLESKTLDARFLSVVKEGLGCSAFEAQAVLGVVKEVYFPFVDEAAAMGPPGKVTVIAVSAEEPAGRAPPRAARPRPGARSESRGAAAPRP